MGFNVEQFKGYFKSDFAKSALFEVFFPTFADLRFQVSSAVLPGSTVGTDVFTNGPYRPIERPITRGYSASPFNFILDNEGRCLSALNSMMDSVVDPDGFVGYPVQYESNATITHYNQSGGKVSTYTLHDCFISSISDVNLDWSNGDAVASVACTLSYKSYSMSSFGGSVSVRARFGEADIVDKVEPENKAPKLLYN